MATFKERLTALAKRLSPVKYSGLKGAFFRRIDGIERIAYCDACGNAKDAIDMVAAMKLIVSLSLCDANGTREYNAPDEIVIDGETLEALAKEAAAVNGLGPENLEGQEKKAPPATPGVIST